MTSKHNQIAWWTLIVRHNAQVYRKRKNNAPRYTSKNPTIHSMGPEAFIDQYLRPMLGEGYTLLIKRLVRFEQYSVSPTDLRICYLVRKAREEELSWVLKTIHELYKQKPLGGYF